MAKIADPIVVRSGFNRLWAIDNVALKPVLNSQNTVNYFWLHEALHNYFRKLYFAKLVQIKISPEPYVIKIYLSIILTWTWKYDPQFFLKKNLRFGVFNNITEQFFLNKRAVPIVATLPEFIEYTNRIMLKKIEATLSSHMINNRFQFEGRSLLPLQVIVSNIFEKSDEKVFNYWTAYHTSMSEHLWMDKKKKFFSSTVKTLFVSSQFSVAEIVAKHIAAELRKIRRHFDFIKFFTRLLDIIDWYHNDHTYIKVTIKGCIQDSLRTKKIVLNSRKAMYAPISSFDTNYDYRVSHSSTAFGVLGVKTWYTRRIEK